jgi:major histocompatibility complex class I
MLAPFTSEKCRKKLKGLSHVDQDRRSQLGVVAHTFNPSTWEAEAGGFLSSRPVWSTE